MPAPTTIAEFVELARKSGVLDEKRLEAHIEKLRQSNTLPPEPNKLAGVLVRDGLLTLFQAEQLVQGKWRRFTIGRYKVLERLGAGGMGSVYLCEHILMRRRVAVKILPNTKSEDQSAVERFHREARVVAALDHPNIVRAYDADEADGLHFLVMEHVDGASLQDVVKKHGPMDVLRACHYMRQCALGLQHAHEKAAIVHRDVKPGNILIDRSGIVKILDMGLARFFHDDQDALTRKYDENVLGTADYLSPEQAEDSHTVDIRSDLYSLGGTFYYCLTGQPPFAEGSVAQKLIWHQTRQPKPISTYRKDVPEGVIQILNTMMAKNRDQRYATPMDVADALEPFTQTPIPPPPDNEMPQLSPAAMGLTYINSSSGSDSAVQSGKGKSWQVNTSGNSRPPATAEPATKPSSRPPSGGPPRGSATSTPPPVVVAPTRPVGKVTTTTPSPGGIPTPPAPKSAPKATVPKAPVIPSKPVPGVSPTLPPHSQQPPPPTTQPSGASATPRVPGTPLLQAAPLPSAVPLNEKDPPDENEVGWNQLGNAEDATERLDTEPPSSHRRGTRGLTINQEKEAARARMRLFALIGGIGGIFALLVIVVVYFAIIREPAKTSSASNTTSEPQSQTYRVGVGGEYPSIAKIGDRLKPGDRIIIVGSVFEEQVINPAYREKLNGVTIEGDGGAVVWRRPTNSPRKDYVLYLVNTRNVHVKGFIFEGNGQTESLIGLTGDCSGTTFENIQLRAPTISGFRFLSCEGSKEQPVSLSTLIMETPTLPLAQFEMGITQKKNNNIHLEQCSAKGQKAKVMVVGDSIAGDVTLPGNVDRQQK